MLPLLLHNFNVRDFHETDSSSSLHTNIGSHPAWRMINFIIHKQLYQHDLALFFGIRTGVTTREALRGAPSHLPRGCLAGIDSDRARFEIVAAFPTHATE